MFPGATAVNDTTTAFDTPATSLTFAVTVLDSTVRNVILGLALISIIFGALVALVQTDFKRLVAYSSVSHMGFVTLGIFALTAESLQGAMMVQLAHGLSSAGLFLLVVAR